MSTTRHKLPMVAVADSNLPDMIETADEPERPSITEVDGKVARFAMAYSLEHGDRRTFGIPARQLWPSMAYLTFSLAFVALVLFAHYGASSNSRLFVWIVEGDRNRPLGSGPLAGILALSALATYVRARMRGVIITTDGIETRTIGALGVPRVQKWAWPQIDRLIMDGKSVIVELWDGTYERLPVVRDTVGLTDTLGRIATTRKKQVTLLGAVASSAKNAEKQA